jgi:hypothetical protein
MAKEISSAVGTPSRTEVVASATSAVERQGRQVLRQRVRTTPVAWLAHTQLTLEEWQEYGTRLGSVSKSTNWWLGDWLRFGQRHYNDHRYEVATQITGYDEQTLMNFAYVASRYEISRRREILSWSHHAELASLNQTDQDLWLDQAAAHHLSVRQLRSKVRQSGRAAIAADQPGTSANTNQVTRSGDTVAVVCADCGHTTNVPLETLAALFEASRHTDSQSD